MIILCYNGRVKSLPYIERGDEYMNKYKSIDFMDLYFGDKKLSDFGFYVGGVEGYRQYSVLPARENVTGKPIGSEITNVYSRSLQP